MKYDIQINQGAAPWQITREAALAAEEANFRTLWILDHLSSFGNANVSMLECFSTLGALAEATTSIRLGSLVANAQLRNPGVLAASATTIQNISGGRFTLGVGAGASPTSKWSIELHQLGLKPSDSLIDRHVHTANVIATLQEQWSDDSSGYDGFPRPTSPIEIVVGINSIQLADIAINMANGINIRADHPDVKKILRHVSDNRAKTSSNWSTSVWINWDVSLLDPDNKKVRDLAELGVDTIVLTWIGAPDPDQIERVRVINPAE